MLLFNPHWGLTRWCSGKESATCQCRKYRDVSSIPGSERSPGRRNGSLLQYSCLENFMDRGAWWTAVHEVAKSQIQLSTHAMCCVHVCVSYKTSKQTRRWSLPYISIREWGKVISIYWAPIGAKELYILVNSMSFRWKKNEYEEVTYSELPPKWWDGIWNPWLLGLPARGMRVPSLVGKLRSHMLREN